MAITYTAGTETRVNSTTADRQNDPAIAALSGGGYVVTWTSARQDGPDYGVFMQRYDAAGVAQGGETRVNTTTTNHQFQPSVAALSGGGYVVTWTSGGQDGSSEGVYMQRYDASGMALGSETRVNTTTLDGQSEPSIAALSGGGYVVTWRSNAQDGDSMGVYMQRYDAAGMVQGGETLVNTTTANLQFAPSIAALSGGGYVVTWTSIGQDGSGSGVYMQRYDASGGALGVETQVNTTTFSDQGYPDVAALSGGGYVVTWTSYEPTDSAYDVFTQRYDAAGVAQGNQTRVNTTIQESQSRSQVVALVDGGYAVTWMADMPSGGMIQAPHANIYMQRYDATGVAQGGETLVNTTTVNRKEWPSIATLADGSIVLTWQSDRQDGSDFGVYSKIFRAVDSVITVAASTDQASQTLTNKDGITFTAAATATFVASQFGAGKIDNAVAITGNAAANAIVVNKTNGDAFSAAGWGFTNWTDGADVITLNGSFLSEAITGSSRNDIIVGGNGNDSLTGGAANDTFVYTAGADIITDFMAGGSDDLIDLRSFTNINSLSDVNTLASDVGANTVLTFSAGNTLTLNNVTKDALTAADFLLAFKSFNLGGGAQGDAITGQAGNDTIDGGAGSDTLSGQDGDDIIYFDAEDDAANVTGGNGFDILNVVGGNTPTGFDLATQGFERAYHHLTDTDNQTWSSIRDIYATSWSRMQSNIFMDDGTRQDRNFDHDSSKAYSEYSNYHLDVARADAVTRQMVVEDTGTKQERFFDYQNNQIYSEYINFYADAAMPNAVTRQVVFEDAGTKQERIFDYNNAQAAYSEYINLYNAEGFVYRQVGFNDAGQKTWDFLFD